MRRLAVEHGAYAAEINTRLRGRAARARVALAEAVIGSRRGAEQLRLRLPDRRADRGEDPRHRADACTAATTCSCSRPRRRRRRSSSRQASARLPICMAKTHLSLSHDPTLRNAPTGFTVPVRDLRPYTGRRLDRGAVRRHDDHARPRQDARPRTRSTSTPTATRSGSSSRDAGIRFRRTPTAASPAARPVRRSPSARDMSGVRPRSCCTGHVWSAAVGRSLLAWTHRTSFATSA